MLRSGPAHPGNKGSIICRSKYQVISLEAFGAIGCKDQFIDCQATLSGRWLIVVRGVFPTLKLALIGHHDAGYGHHQDDESRENAGAQM